MFDHEARIARTLGVVLILVLSLPFQAWIRLRGGVRLGAQGGRKEVWVLQGGVRTGGADAEGMARDLERLQLCRREGDEDRGGGGATLEGVVREDDGGRGRQHWGVGIGRTRTRRVCEGGRQGGTVENGRD